MRTPTFVLVALAWLALTGVWARLPERPPPAVLARARALTVERDPRRMSARELRQLPGVGERLALSIAGARDAFAGPGALAWEDVPGIGEVRGAAIRAWLRARGIEPDPLAGGAGARAGYAAPVMRDRRRELTALAALLAACGGAGSSEAPSLPAAEPAAPRMDAKAMDATTMDAPAAEPEGARAEPDEAVVELELEVPGGRVHALACGAPEQDLVLLLHGGRFRADTWRELGTLTLLARSGFRALALDWPGYGATPAFAAEPEPRALLEAVLDRVGAARALVVAPSLAGTFAFPLVAGAPARVAGFVPIAPAGIDDFAPQAGARVPTLILWGEKDEIVPVARATELAGRLPGARVEILPGASHPCYLDRPELFHGLLVAFAREAFGGAR